MKYVQEVIVFVKFKVLIKVQGLEGSTWKTCRVLDVRVPDQGHVGQGHP